MRPVPKGGASGSTVFDLSHFLHGHSAIFPEKCVGVCQSVLEHAGVCGSVRDCARVCGSGWEHVGEWGRVQGSMRVCGKYI